MSLVAGAVTSLAFPPHSATWLVWIALVPWLIGLDRVSLVGTGLVSIVFALGLCLPLGGWIPDTAAGGFGADPLGAYGLWVATSASFAPAIALLKVLLRGLSIRSPVFALAAGAGWGLVELSFGRIWPTIPYVTLGATQIETPIAAMAEVLGAHGVSAVVAAANALVAQAMLLRKLRVLIPASALAAVVLLIAVVPPSEPARGGALRVALVQPAVPLTGPPDSRFQHDNLEALIALTRDCPASLPS